MKGFLHPISLSNRWAVRLSFLILSVVCVSLGAHAQRWDNYPPANKYVRLTQTNLPIVFINVNTTMILREERITARMKIIDNGEGELNYADTVNHPGQRIDYDGYAAIKYRGNSSFDASDKKPYSIKLIDKPLEEGGEKLKAKLLGMGKDNDWVLLAPYSDKSMIRDVLSFELARRYFDFVPHARFCELFLDGTYYGVYILSERVRKGKHRLPLNDPGEDDGDLTGDYHFEIDRPDEPHVYYSKQRPVFNNGTRINWRSICFQYKSPEYEDFATLPGGTRLAMINELDKMETALASNNYTDPDLGYAKYIDVTSFIDYQLSTEFAFNIDGYRLSTNIYKMSKTHAENEGLDHRWKMSLWDMNIAFGNANYYEGNRTDKWQYEFNDRHAYEDGNVVPFWWQRLMSDPEYVRQLKTRWTQYRQEDYSDEHIEFVIDSLVADLTCEGAVDRNQQAWRIIGKNVWPNYFVGQTYGEEIDYLKDWIQKRVAFLDKNWYDEQLDIPQLTNGDEGRSALPSRVYAIDGQRVNAPRKGINIIRRADGSTYKIGVR